MKALDKMLDDAGIPHPPLEVLTTTDRGEVLIFVTSGGKPPATLWHQLQDLSAKLNHWPVMLGKKNELKRHLEQFELNADPVEETLAYAKTIDGQQWLTKRAEERLDEFKEYNPGEDPSQFAPPVGEWKNSKPNSGFVTPFDILSKKPAEYLVIGLIPTVIPWEVPAFLHLGNWNECPEAAVHCAVEKFWQEKYGAVIAAATPDVIEMQVQRPPTTREAALDLAKQQFDYCADIVDQGTETIAALASGLLNGTSWYFWWD